MIVPAATTTRPDRRYTAADRQARAVAIADLDGDDINEIVVANGDDGTVQVLRRDVTGAFISRKSIAVGNDPSALVVGDFDGL